MSRPSEIAWEELPDDHYGGQFNPKSIFGLTEEGNVRVTYNEKSFSYPDGETYRLRYPTYNFEDLGYGNLPADIMISPRIAPHLVGLGLLEAISEEDILLAADEFDKNNDGISGKANYAFNHILNKNTLGRFGWKANQPTVRQQVAAAFVGDIGITSSLFPNEECAPNQQGCKDAYNEGEPELSTKILDRVTLYSAALAVPKRRNFDQPDVISGQVLFRQVGCNSCHMPKYVTGEIGEIPEFANETIYPYTDLLLHDMGTELADNRPDGLANGNEWRTPPLWGIGLIQTVNNHTFLLHDGRARGIEEAILWHGGEASQVIVSFKKLPKEERTHLVNFVKSL